MGETLTERRRVSDEALRGVKLFCWGRNAGGLIRHSFDGTRRISPANSVPAAAVIRGEQTLFGITGRKGRVGGPVSGV